MCRCLYTHHSTVLTPQGCFDSAIERYEYGGAYRGVFPVKCNHDRELLAAVLQAGKPFGFGLEARVTSIRALPLSGCSVPDLYAPTLKHTG